MSKLEDKLLELKELLEKGMKNSGLGGSGSVKNKGAVLPSISKMPKPGHTSQAGDVGIPGQASASKKSPIKAAEQTHNKDIKDIKMKEAHAELAMKKGEEISIAKNGQWTLDDVEKSGYKGYTPEDNARRKANNTGETTGIHTMDSVKTYGGSGPSAADREAKEMKAKSKKNPVKIFTPEEIAEMNTNLKKEEDHKPYYDYKGPKGSAASHINDAKTHLANKDIKNARKSLNWAKEVVERRQPVKAEKPKEIVGEPTKTMEMDKTEGRTTVAPGVSEMGIEVRRSNPKDTSYSKVASPAKHGEAAKEIARTNIKQTSAIKPKLPQ